MTLIVDTHAHLDLPAYDGDRDAALDRARTMGVGAIVLIGYDPQRWESTRELCASRIGLVRTVGIHPNSAELWTDSVAEQLEREVESGSPVAIGEIGLDFFREHADAAIQRVAFREQLKMASTRGLPISIHQRAAGQEVLDMLSEFAPIRGVMHCFDGDAAFANACLDLGMYLGIGGAITYPRAEQIRIALKSVPLERILFETDSPFLAPQPHRGRRNEPAYLPLVVNLVAEILNRTTEEVSVVTSRNAVELFGDGLGQAVTAIEESLL